ncbi:MAG: hypothetical protein AAF224_06660 [Pseudomonadota bacterium]
MNLKSLVIGGAFAAAMAVAPAMAAPITLTGDNPNGPGQTSVSFDTDNAPVDVRWVQGGVFSGLPANRREPCTGAGPINGNGVRCNAPELIGYSPTDDIVELTSSNVAQRPRDVISVTFANPLVNGAGDDLYIFEAENQSDSPAFQLTLGGADLIGVARTIVELEPGDFYTVWGFDLSNSPLNLADGASVAQPIFIATADGDGSADIAAVVGLNFGDPPVIPLPASAPLFLAGLVAWRRFARRK